MGVGEGRRRIPFQRISLVVGVSTPGEEVGISLMQVLCHGCQSVREAC